MEFKIIINKWANFYFFIQNLSEWHFSYRKEYNLAWRNELSIHSSEEETALQNFKKIRSNYGSSKTFFEQSFFVFKYPLKKIKKYLTHEQYCTIKKTFFIFKKKFNILYKKELPLLKRWKKQLLKEINNPINLKLISQKLTTLFGAIVPIDTKTKIYLLCSDINRTGGGANIDNQSISLEISRYSLININQAIGIIWHEIIHLIFQNQKFYPLLLKCFPSDPKTINLINEIVVGTLLPRGILGIRILKNKPLSNILPNINSEQTIKLLNLTKKYIDQNKQLDKIYIEKLLVILKGA
jgi:hypothetical protein